MNFPSCLINTCQQISGVSVSIGKEISRGKWGVVCEAVSKQNLPSPPLVVKCILLERESDRKSYDEDCEEDCNRTVSLSQFEAEGAMTTKMGKLGVGPQCFGWTVLKLPADSMESKKNDTLNIGIILIQRLQFTLIEYTSIIRDFNNCTKLWRDMEDKVIEKSVLALSAQVVHTDLTTGENIMINTDSDMKPVDVFFIDWGFTWTPQDLVANHTCSIASTLRNKLLFKPRGTAIQ